MTLIKKIGDVVQTSREMTFEWNIRDFSSVSDKVGDFYISPVFGFADSTWYLRLYPAGERMRVSGWMSLYLFHGYLESDITVSYTFGIKNFAKNLKESEYVFSPKEINGRGYQKFCFKTTLLQDASRLLQNDILTITCHLKCFDLQTEKVSMSNRLRKVSLNMKTLLDSGERADFTLKLGDREWPVHRVILQSRCKYFENMFRHEWIENCEGEVKFEDMDEDAVNSVLRFIYTGVVEDMFTKDVFEIYAAAHLFLLDDLKDLCVERMSESMSVETVCKALILADTYGEEDLRECATEFYVQESEKIFETEEWKELEKNNFSVVVTLLKETTKRSKIEENE